MKKLLHKLEVMRKMKVMEELKNTRVRVVMHKEAVQALLVLKTILK